MFARLLALKIFACLLLVGCAQTHKPANVPSTAGVHGKIVETQQSIKVTQAKINEAAAAVKAAGGDNTKLKEGLDAMDRKGIIIDRWLDTHP